MDWLTVEDIRKLKPKMIYYGAQTPWWTHDPAHLCSTGKLKMMMKTGQHDKEMKEVESPGLPCDPLGGMLMQTDKVDAFLDAAKANPQHHGKHGLRAFEAAHHSNAQALNIVKCFKSWDLYNAWLDRVDSLDGHAPTDHMRFA